MRSPAERIEFTLNGQQVEIQADPMRRLADVLRDTMAMTGTKIGCNAGDCGACTVLLDGRQVCACLVPAARVDGRSVVTVEGLARDGLPNALQDAFLRHGAAQCGFCTPGMLMAASELLAQNPEPTEPEVRDALGGVLCRCTGYRKIIEAVLDVAAERPAAGPEPRAVGARLAKVDGNAKLNGSDRFGADALPAETVLSLRAVRSPHAHARFTLGDFTQLLAAHPGLVRVLTAADVPGRNLYGIYPTGKDQPVLAETRVRHRGETVCALVGDAETLAAISDSDLPIIWDVLPKVTFENAASAPDLHAHAPGNVRTGRWRTRRSAPTSPPTAASSSTPISSPKRVTRAASATGSRSSPALRLLIWIAMSWDRSSASPPPMCGSCPPRSAADLAASWTCRCSR
jgi:aldehyde oxidoreductase